MSIMKNEEHKNCYNNVVSLKEYVDTKLIDIKTATDLAAENLKVRLNNLNEWREQNKSERANYLTRNEYDSKHELLNTKIETLQKFVWMGLGALLLTEILLKYFK